MALYQTPHPVIWHRPRRVNSAFLTATAPIIGRTQPKSTGSARTAEEVVLPAMDGRVLRPGRVDVHAADDVLHSSLSFQSM